MLFVLRIVLLRASRGWISIFVAWDGLGITRFFLVIYYCNWDSISGAMVTVITNRLGDVILFIVVVYLLVEIKNINSFIIPMGILLLAAITKSAQVPFRSWLPKAIAAPTPVRRLVHRRTLVTAGLFLITKFE